ncbi:hypothetical protein ABFS83_10G180000 [Erythranthe nasuta]
MASSALDDKLTNEIFSILENKFLFGQYQFQTNNVYSPGKVRILSIDAGGDAILAANILIHFQSILRRKSGVPSAHIADFFDVVTGAGAGGILAGLLSTPKDGIFFTPEESLEFMVDNRRKLGRPHSHSLLGRSKAAKVLKKVFGESTLKDTVKSVLIPCYDLRTGAPFVFSRADAMEMEGCDFTMAGVCGATVADRAVEVKSTDGRRKIVAVGGGVGMSNPTAAAITHVLNNKQEFPLCRGVQDLLVVSLGNPSSSSSMSSIINSSSLFVKIAGDGAAEMVDEAVSMAFGDEWRASNYLRINSGNDNKKVEEMLGAKNMESVLFKGKRLVEMTNMEKLEMFAGELIKEKERRAYCISSSSSSHQHHHHHQNMSNYSPRSSSSDTTTLSSTTSS